MRTTTAVVALGHALLLKSVVSIQPTALPVRGGYTIGSFFGNTGNTANFDRPNKREGKDHESSQIRKFRKNATSSRPKNKKEVKDPKSPRIIGFSNKANKGHYNHVHKSSRIRGFGNRAERPNEQVAQEYHQIRDFGKAFLTPLPPARDEETTFKNQFQPSFALHEFILGARYMCIVYPVLWMTSFLFLLVLKHSLLPSPDKWLQTIYYTQWVDTLKLRIVVLCWNCATVWFLWMETMLVYRRRTLWGAMGALAVWVFTPGFQRLLRSEGLGVVGAVCWLYLQQALLHTSSFLFKKAGQGWGVLTTCTTTSKKCDKR